jgi:hypothetical protein
MIVVSYRKFRATAAKGMAGRVLVGAMLLLPAAAKADIIVGTFTGNVVYSYGDALGIVGGVTGDISNGPAVTGTFQYDTSQIASTQNFVYGPGSFETGFYGGAMTYSTTVGSSTFSSSGANFTVYHSHYAPNDHYTAAGGDADSNERLDLGAGSLFNSIYNDPTTEFSVTNPPSSNLGMNWDAGGESLQATITSLTVTDISVPEPASLGLLGIGMVCAGLARSRTGRKGVRQSQRLG